ncbi:MAG: ribulokinase, partial [Armatimonadetes bacterium]|nr:ribulokinase [Armatimonadota bacterium]
MAYSIGLDFGTNSVRAVVVSCADGAEVGTCVVDYPSGEQGILLEASDHNLARQFPGDYVYGLEASVLGALEDSGVSPDQVIGIGAAATGSSPMPVDAKNVPLAMHSEWKDDLNAQCWLWKDHTGAAEAARITEVARAHRPQYVAKCGNTYSSEWFWSKVWHCLNVAPHVFEAAHGWVEKADWIPSVLAGVTEPAAVMAGVCAAGHKALYAEDWGGLPDEEFLEMLDPALAGLRSRLYTMAHDASVPAGRLCAEWAEKLGLEAGIPIAIGELDVHYGAIGAG